MVRSFCERAVDGGYLMELEPKFVDVAIRRWQDFTGLEAMHLASGRAFSELAIERRGLVRESTT